MYICGHSFFLTNVLFSKLCIVHVRLVIFMQVISELNGKDINEVMNSGKTFHTLTLNLYLDI